MAGAQANIHTYLAPLTGSGRIAPTLLQDIKLYDPHFQSPSAYNLLASGPINFGGKQYLYQFIPERSCRHTFWLQPRQTIVPDLDEQPGAESKYQVAAVCQICRVHICLTVDYTTLWKGRPCPNEERPVHHLIRSTYHDNIAHSEAGQYGSGEVYSYQCSSPTCSAVVTVRLSPEVINEEAVHVLTSSELLKQRTDEAFAARSGDTEGMRRPSATDVLIDLRTYIRNAWKTESKSEISLDNKRFAVRFGPGGVPCAEVLESLGFVLRPGEAWQVPRPVAEETSLLKHPRNVFLDNVESELSVLILNRPDPERQNSQDGTTLHAADWDFARVLGCQNYDRSRESRTGNLDPANRPMPYTLLGIPQDIADEIISNVYDWQCRHHIQGAPHYLSSLRSIAMQRGSEFLDTKCAIEESNGRVTYEQLVKAYKSLGLSMNITPDDDHIIGTFESRAQDARNQETELRESLRVIGVGLNSNKLIDHASREITSYEQALTYLDVTHETSDEFVQSMYTLKVTEHASQQEMAAKAVKLIAMHRRSNALNSWIADGFSGRVDSQMDLGEAYSTFEIDDRTMDDATILAVYNVRKTEVTEKERLARFTRALTAIAQSRNSPLLLSELQMTSHQALEVALTEPVGLDNIGNTCYLNSLLQFLFTIKPVRDIVLDFDRYKMETSSENMSVKKVGQRKISVKEVETAQRFATSLARLFQSMITASKTAIRPEQELARLTLETDQVKEKIRRRSTLAGATRPSLGTIDNREIQGPLLPYMSQTNGFSDEIPLLSPESASVTESDSNPIEKLRLRATNPDPVQEMNDDNSSEATLVSRPNSGLNTPAELISPEQQQEILDNKENFAPLKLEPSKEIASGEPLRPASPSKINAQAGALANKGNDVDNTVDDQQMIYQPPPGPPPVPPRKMVENTTSTLEEYARQQDVTEVVGHCLFQLSCAMRPTGFDKSGEQQDEIHDLFFGESRSHTLPEKPTPDTPLPFLNVQAAVNNQPRDIYAALDNYFDLSDAGNGRQGYVSITRLPPILTITLGRVVWDDKTKSQKKLDHHVELPQTLYMDRYLESEPDSTLVQKRMQSWTLKQELADLFERKAVLEQQHAESIDVPTLFDDARRCLEYLEKEVTADPRYGGPVEFDPELKIYLSQIAEQKRNELDTAKSLIALRNEQLDSLFTSLQVHPYKLHAAFFHRGSHGSGHYWVYILDHKANVWRKYNDDHVTPVFNLGEIFDKPDTAGGWSGPANPYFLVYVKQGEEPDSLQALIETVKREPLPISDDFDGIDFEPLGSGSAVAKGLMRTTSGHVPSQMTEMPPETADQHWSGREVVNLDLLMGDNEWAGNGVAAAGKSTAGEAGGIEREGKGGGWSYTDANPGTKW